MKSCQSVTFRAVRSKRCTFSKPHYRIHFFLFRTDEDFLLLSIMQIHTLTRTHGPEYMYACTQTQLISPLMRKYEASITVDKITTNPSTLSVRRGRDTGRWSCLEGDLWPLGPVDFAPQPNPGNTVRGHLWCHNKQRRKRPIKTQQSCLNTSPHEVHHWGVMTGWCFFSPTKGFYYSIYVSTLEYCVRTGSKRHG